MAEVVLDASAILARILHEPGREAVEAVIDGAYVSAVNIAEVAQRLVDIGAADEVIVGLLDELPCSVEPLRADASRRVGLLRRATRTRGLSLGDRACLDLARGMGLPAHTADHAWAELDVGVEVVLIR